MYETVKLERICNQINGNRVQFSQLVQQETLLKLNNLSQI